MSILAGDNQTTNAGEAVSVAPAVKVVDASNRALASISVTFTVTGGGGNVTAPNATTGSDGVATVGSWILGTSGGNNTLTATVAGSGVSGNPSTFHATGRLAAFQPTTSLSVSAGTYNYSDVTIPAGVTVTLTGDVTINAQGSFTLAGTITGNCVGVSVNAQGALALNGQISNNCTGAIPGTGAPGVHLVGKGGYSVNKGSTLSSGAVDITNDPTLSDADFSAPTPAPEHLAGLAAAGGPRCQFVEGTFTAVPTVAPDGAVGTTGQPGQPGAAWAASCRGDMVVTGPFSLVGQGGGAGGTGISLGPSAQGGAGGLGGDIKLRATGTIEFSTGSSTSIRSGDGGNGGGASSFTTRGITRVAGGVGSAPGLIEVRARGAIFINAPLNLIVGQGGNGGNASSGSESFSFACDRAILNEVTAIGGAGGSTPNKILQGSSVTGLTQVTVSGGTPGKGGDATGSAVNGGDGAQACKPGETGGSQLVLGGRGGDALLKDRNGALLRNGGNGGGATFSGGRGGKGFNGCPPAVLQDGGMGGRGGAATGYSGFGGSGIVEGMPGGITLNGVANGGNGGDGANPGDGGGAGPNLIGSGTTTAASFTAGTRGNTCARILVNPVIPLTSTNQETTTQANYAVIRIAINVTRQNFNTDVLLTPGATDPGITSTFTVPQNLPPPGDIVIADITVDNAAIGDHTLTFAATATVGGQLVTGQGSFVIHVPGGDRYAPVTVTRDFIDCGGGLNCNDQDHVETGTKMVDVKEIAILKEMIGTVPKITVWGLMIAHHPITLVRSGDLAFDGSGNFLATAFVNVPVAGHADQPAVIDIQGVISPGSISFKILIDAAGGAPFQFRRDAYTGGGPKKP